MNDESERGNVVNVYKRWKIGNIGYIVGRQGLKWQQIGNTIGNKRQHLWGKRQPATKKQGWIPNGAGYAWIWRWLQHQCMYLRSNVLPLKQAPFPLKKGVLDFEVVHSLGVGS